MDRRLTPANGRVAATCLRGQVNADRFTDGTPAQIARPVVDLLCAPGDRRERQLLFGAPVTVYEQKDGWAFVQATSDGFVGYVPVTALADPVEATHRVSVLATHLYPRPAVKAHETCWLSFGSKLRIVSAEGAFFETDQGQFVPKPHVRPLKTYFTDPVTVAQLHFGVPYLWGGNSAQGIDCSGLVQAAFLASGIACPGDSDQQRAALGHDLPPGTAVLRGDLFFWPGHEAMAVDGDTLIHANGHHMAVAYEPIADTIARIDAQGEGPLTAHKRL